MKLIVFFTLTTIAQVYSYHPYLYIQPKVEVVDTRHLNQHFGALQREEFIFNSVKPPSCNLKRTLKENEIFSLQSPSFPEKYPSFINCNWNLYGATAQSKLKINCTRFELPPSVFDICNPYYDYLSIDRGEVLYTNYCGRSKVDVVSALNKLTLRFRAAVNVQHTGFNCQVFDITSSEDRVKEEVLDSTVVEQEQKVLDSQKNEQEQEIVDSEEEEQEPVVLDSQKNEQEQESVDSQEDDEQEQAVLDSQKNEQEQEIVNSQEEEQEPAVLDDQELVDLDIQIQEQEQFTLESMEIEQEQTTVVSL